MAPNEGRNNWCHFELRDFDFETFRDFFRLQDQKTSGAKARWHSLEGRPCTLGRIVPHKSHTHYMITTYKMTHSKKLV